MAKNISFDKSFEKYFDKYFKFHEFDSPDMPGSGEKFMSHDFLGKLSIARHVSQSPFQINSGYRTEAHNNTLRSFGYMVSPISSHMKGLAADIHIANDLQRFKVLYGLQYAGFTRIGIGKYFIHVDMDESKTQNIIWTYYKM